MREWWTHRGGDGELQLIDSGLGLVPLCRQDGVLRFVGEADLIDYRSPLGNDSAEMISAHLESVEPGTPIHFDSLPSEAAAAVGAGFEAAGITVQRSQHDLTAVVSLPGSYSDWLHSLGRKQRHEVRRKQRRFERAGGKPTLTRFEGQEATAAFAALHRKAGGDKGAFMTEGMEAYFAALHQNAGGRIDVLEGPDGGPIAAAFGFEDDGAYYLYNSAYEPSAAYLSPGIVLVTSLIRSAVRSGKHTFDFLKGDEMYKFRLGAVARPLYEFSAVKGAGS